MTRKKKVPLPPKRVPPATPPPVLRRMILTFEIESPLSPDEALRVAHFALVVNQTKPKSMGVVLCAPQALKTVAKERLISMINELETDGD